MPAHTSLMASSTTDGNLADYDDAAVDAGAKPRSCAMVLEVMDTGS